jgi:Phage tail assembly chaperone protein, TAC
MGLRPRDFWAMSLPEWRAACAGFSARFGRRRVPPLGRAELAQLIETYPDKER